MEALSCAASVIAVIQLTGSIVTICGGYIKAVKDARADIALLQQEVASLLEIVKKLAELLDSEDGKKLSTSQTLANDAASCMSVLTLLRERIDPENTPKRTRTMRKWGLRALKWPLKRTELEQTIQKLERYKSSFNLALQVDQAPRVFEVSQAAKRIEQKIDLEGLPMAQGAEFDSYMDQHESECLSGTRTDVCREIEEWAVSSQGKHIFWLNGMAGTGKSTISRTMAKLFQRNGLLGASFFFKKGEGDRGNAAKLFPTITRQLLTRCPGLLPAVIGVIKDDPRISGKPLKEQFKKLLLQPLLGLESMSYQALRLVIVIDALDECENDNDIRTILQLLPRLQESTSLHLRVFLTSRPELPIRSGFRAVRDDHQGLVLHEVSRCIIERDISLFLEHKLVAIRQERSLSPDWPGDVNVQTLLTMSVPLFIFAATICRLFEDHDLDPEQCLADILKYQNEESKLDGTYLPVLDRLASKYSGIRQRRFVQEVQEVIGAIILLESPLSAMSLSKLMGISITSITARLNSLHSVLDIPTNETLPVRLLHLSFRDFLLDSNTREKTPFWVNENEMNQKLTTYCLSVMRGQLKKNMCNLQCHGTERRNIDTQSINHYLPPELQYSCRYWTHHLARSRDPKSQINDVLAFLDNHFLHWVEVMSMLGIVSEVLGGISTLQLVVQDDKDNSGISEFLHDGQRFILKNSQIADIAPLQIYSSGLIFAPKLAIIRRRFEGELPIWIHRCLRVEESWSPDLQTLEGHSGWVWSVAFSADGRLLASGSDDMTIKLWDPNTGALKHTLEGHSSWVQSVAFSADGRLLASGSDDETIKLWDPSTGALKHTLEGHSKSVRSVAFSADGRLLASSSNDNTIKLWDPSTGALKHTLEGHSDSVWSVTFSADGRLLASSSDDNTIKLWDPSTGALKHTLEGHSKSVQSVAFSADGRLLASSSNDNTIKLWDPSTGALKHTLEGHSDSVWSVTFSADGRLLASGSDDKTIKLWDPSTGALKQTLEGHSSWVQSVAFSADGRLLASGSNDKAIKLWDPNTGAVKHTLDGHSKSVRSVAFSADGRLLASSSNDNTIKLWDPSTGALKHTLEGHSDSVWPVTFSADGRLLASGSDDKTIKLWDPSTGALKHTLEGHSGWVQSVTFSADGRLLASGSNDETIKLWDPSTGALKHTLEGHSKSVWSVAFSADGRLLASGSNDKTIKLWDPNTGALKHTLEGHSDWVRSVAFSADGRLLASGSDDETIKVWDPSTGALKHTISTDGYVNDIEFSFPYLVTNRGSFNIQAWHESFSSDSSRSNIELSLQAGRWVTIQGQRELWLPPDYQPTASAVKDGAIVLGCSNGRVYIITFSM